MPTSKKKTPMKKASENKPTLVAFLLDRSGSMTTCKDETINGFNNYVTQLRKKETGNCRFTLTQFDSLGIDIIHDAVPLKDVDKLNDETYQPRDFTPLYDAIGRTIRDTEKKAGTKFKVLFVTLTDGQENASREFNKDSIKALIKKMEDENHWTFAYVGVGFDGFSAATVLAMGTQGAGNVLRTSGKNTVKAYGRLAGQTVNYMSCAINATKCSTDFWAGNKSTEDDE
jgi:von Willebrand factor type A domain-containing protein